MPTLAEIRQEEDRFYALMGRCITIWASIEARLYHLFTTALDSPSELTGILFWSFPSFSMRLSYTSALVNECLSAREIARSQKHLTEKQKLWSDLSTKLKKEYDFRNRLAHQHVPKNRIEMEKDENGEERHLIIKAVTDRIIPNPYDPKQNFEPIVSEEIRERISAAQSLDFSLKHFTAMFPSWRREK